MTDEANSLTGVVLPGDPEQTMFEGMPEDSQGSAYREAHDKVVQALAMTEEALRTKRKLRDETEAEIKELVREKDWLERMNRAPKGRKGKD